MEAHCIARQGNEKQRGQPLRKSGLSELKNSNAMSSKEAHSGAQQGMAKKSTATRYADSMSRYIELKDSTEAHCNELQRKAAN